MEAAIACADEEKGIFGVDYRFIQNDIHSTTNVCRYFEEDNDADTSGSLMIEENVVSATGIDFIMPEAEIRRIIEDAGFTPRRRYQDYALVQDRDAGCPCCAWRTPVGV